MKIDIVGCHCTWQKELSTSFIVDDIIAVDTPQESFKTLLVDYDISKWKYIFITHFHSDHFMSLHLVADVLYKRRIKDVTIIGPKGIKQKLLDIVKIVEADHLINFIEENLKFIECENNKRIQLGQYKIKMFRMLHQSLDAYGYTIQKDNKTAGFSGDTALCNNLIKIIKASDVVFVDCSGIPVNNKHLSVEEILSLKQEFPSTNIIPVHLTVSSEEVLKEKNIIIPYQGQIINLD